MLKWNIEGGKSEAVKRANLSVYGASLCLTPYKLLIRHWISSGMQTAKHHLMLQELAVSNLPKP